jgi:hypothetical protein
LIDYFAELDASRPDPEKAGNVLKMKAGIDPADFDDKSVQEILGVPDDEKKGLDSSYDSQIESGLDENVS